MLFICLNIVCYSCIFTGYAWIFPVLSRLLGMAHFIDTEGSFGFNFVNNVDFLLMRF